jgi:hypothetical protein
MERVRVETLNVQISSFGALLQLLRYHSSVLEKFRRAVGTLCVKR